MVCPAQSMLSASSCAFLQRPQRPRGGIGVGSRLFLVSCNASPSPDESDCNVEECAPEKEVGNLSMEWLTRERTKVVGTFPPKNTGWTGYVEKDTAGQKNIYSVEPTVYVAESAISSGAAGKSSEGSENTVAVTASIALISIAAASSVLLLVNKNQPQLQAPDYSGPPLSYYVAKFRPAQTVEASAEPSGSSTVEASAPPGGQLQDNSGNAEFLLTANSAS